MRFAYNPYPALPSPADRPFLDPSSRDSLVYIHRPDFKVLVSGPDKQAEGVPLWGILDTGASECILPDEVAEQVKPKWCGKGKIIDFAGMSRDLRYGQVYLRIRIEKRRLHWPAIVAFSPHGRNEALWGRRGFLDYFNITFNGPGRYFTIRLRTELPREFKQHPISRSSRSGSKKDHLIAPPDQDP